jgi:type IV pilus assembly protein PilC
MSPSDKARLFLDLAQLVKSGISFTKAAETLAKHARKNTAKTLQAIITRLNAGDTVADALQTREACLDPLEIGIISAADTCGTLPQGLDHCARYYESLASAQQRIRSKLGYPFFLLHFAAILTALPRAFGSEGNVSDALYIALSQLAFLWLIVGAFVFALRLLLKKAAVSPFLDILLRNIPVLGALRRDFALTRFCSAYNMQLNAGISVFLNLEASARASGSPVLTRACTHAAQVISNGGSASDGLASSRAFPEPVIRGFSVGEQTGDLNRELTTIAAQFHQSAIRRLDALSEWLPRVLLIASYAYIGWGIIRSSMAQNKTILDMINGN